MLISGRNLAVETAWILPRNATVELQCFDVWRWFGRAAFYPGFGAAISAAIQRDDCLVHDHGIWSQSNWAAAHAAQRARKPYVLSPRGMLEPWALEYKATKKRIAWMLYQRDIVNNAALMVATSAEECENIKKLLPKMPVAIVPNGVSWPPVLQREFGLKHGSRRLLFMSRVHPKKNILGLVRAWHMVLNSGAAPDWVLQIAGPDELRHTAQVSELVEALGLSAKVELLGSVNEQSKAAVMGAAHALILPSFSENFGVVVAEGMAHGLPVIATTGTPWASLHQHDCGWWVEPSDTALADAISQCTSLSDQARTEMGQRGRRFARESFSWQGIGESMASVYDWVLDRRAPMPSYLHV
jgi:glycosyltransferase involved in cell wall biosynthesis